MAKFILVYSNHTCACVALGISGRLAVHALTKFPPAQNAITVKPL